MTELTAAQRRVISRGRRLLRDFAEDFRIYRQRGMTNQQIAEAMGYRDKHIVSCLLARARRHGLLPRPAVAVVALPGWMGHITGGTFLALTCAVVLVIATVGFLAHLRQQTSDPTAADNRRAHDRDTADRAAEAAHRAQTGDPW